MTATSGTWTPNGTTLSATSGTGMLFGNVLYYEPSMWERAAPVLTPEVQAEYDACAAAARERREARREARRVVRAAATDKAEVLLARLLSPAQRASLEERKFFEVTGSAGFVYRIRRGSSGNIDCLDEAGDVVGRICAHPELGEYDAAGSHLGDLPTGDVLVAQMLALRADELDFARRANVHRGFCPAKRLAELEDREARWLVGAST